MSGSHPTRTGETGGTVYTLKDHAGEIPGLISFRMDWLDLLAVQGILNSLLQHHSTKASILWHSAFFTVQWILNSLLQHHSSKASILQCSAIFMVQLSHAYDYWKNHSFD